MFREISLACILSFMPIPFRVMEIVSEIGDGNVSQLIEAAKWH